MRHLFSILLLSYAFVCTAQDSLVTEKMRKEFRKNQYEMDLNHGGMGLSIFKPDLGKIVSYDQPWIGVNILSDIFEFKIGFGHTHVAGVIDYDLGYTETIDTREFGYQLAAGVNIPLNFLTFGAQHSPFKVFRGHPTINMEMGAFMMRNYSNYQNSAQNKIYYLGINPGYRIRIPQGSIELALNTRLGLTTGDEPDYYQGFGFYPSITFRLDALKWKYNPSMVSVPAGMATVTNVNTTTVYNGTRYNSDGSRVSYYTEYTTADVNVTSFNAGIQDIGPHFGIGPKVSAMNPRRTPYIPQSLLVGVVAEGRGGPIDFGLTLEGGRVGHGSELESKSDPGKYRKKLDKGETFGMGHVSTINMHLNIGMDISPLFLVPFGIVVDKGNATSFLTATAGVICGGHYTWDQEFIDPTISSYYQDEVNKDAGVSKRKFLDPSVVGPGFLGGYYFSVQVGAMSFKVTNYRYFGAPFASNTMVGLAYRFPINNKYD